MPGLTAQLCVALSQIARARASESEIYCFGTSRLQRDLVKGAQLLRRLAQFHRVGHIHLHHLGALPLTGVADAHLQVQWFTRKKYTGRKREIGHTEAGVRQAKAEREQGRNILRLEPAIPDLQLLLIKYFAVNPGVARWRVRGSV